MASVVRLCDKIIYALLKVSFRTDLYGIQLEITSNQRGPTPFMSKWTEIQGGRNTDYK
jgi:hypothetical protein